MIGFCMIAHSAGGPGEWSLVEMMGQGAGIVPWKFQCISSTFAPCKSLTFSLFGVPPSPVSLTLSILAPKWAAPTMKLCTEHCAWVSYVHVPHWNSTSKCPSVAHEVWSCPWLIFMPRSVEPAYIGHGYISNPVFTAKITWTKSEWCCMKK